MRWDMSRFMALMEPMASEEAGRVKEKLSTAMLDIAKARTAGETAIAEANDLLAKSRTKEPSYPPPAALPPPYVTALIKSAGFEGLGYEEKLRSIGKTRVTQSISTNSKLPSELSIDCCRSKATLELAEEKDLVAVGILKLHARVLLGSAKEFDEPNPEPV